MYQSLFQAERFERFVPIHTRTTDCGPASEVGKRDEWEVSPETGNTHLVLSSMARGRIPFRYSQLNIYLSTVRLLA
jgi:hypothetical protein